MPHDRSRPSQAPIPRARRHPWWVGLLAAALLLLASGAAARAAPPPNIVFVLTDDLDWRTTALMPEVQELARAGASFDAAYVTTPICVPSRATFLTGRYPQNTGVRSNRPPTGGYQAFHQNGLEADTVAVWLQRAGYRTALVGKYFNYYPETAPPLHVPPGWDYWAVPETHADMHAKYAYRLNVNGTVVEHAYRERDYSTDVYAAHARRFVADAVAARQPFALFLWFPSPHVREIPAPRHLELFPDLRAPRSVAFPELDMSDKPTFARVPPLDPTRVAEIDESYRNRARMLRSVDEAVGSIRNLLRAKGVLWNSYIVFTSDNGWHQGEHNQTPSKGRAYEEDIRVPLVVAGPGVPPGRRVARLVGNADFAPTFARWAGAEVPPTVDGRSFARLLKARDPRSLPWRKRLPIMRAIEGVPLATAWPEPEREPKSTSGYGCLEHLPDTDRLLPEFRGVRTERYTYVEYTTGDRELYDNEQDPRQVANAYCRAPEGLLRHLHRVAQELSTCRAGYCRRVENW